MTDIVKVQELSDEENVLGALGDIHRIFEKRGILKDWDRKTEVLRCLKIIYGGDSEEQHQSWIAQKGSERALEIFNTSRTKL